MNKNLSRAWARQTGPPGPVGPARLRAPGPFGSPKYGEKKLGFPIFEIATSFDYSLLCVCYVLRLSTVSTIVENMSSTK